MIAAQIEEKDAVRIVNADIPEVGPGDVLIEVANCGICGTDVHIFRGEYMGDYPIIPGHEFSGTVVRVGASVQSVETGQRVAVEPNIACDNCDICLNNRQNFCRNWQAVGVTRSGGMAGYVVAPEKAVFDIGELSFEQAAFVEPLSCVLHGIERAELRLGDRVLIVGAGPIGIQLLRTAQVQGAGRVEVAERNPSRLRFAERSGAAAVTGDLAELPGNAYDVVIDATGAPPVLPRTVELVRPGGRVLWFGVPPAGNTVEIEPFVMFQKGLTVLSSFTSLRNTYQALSLLQEGRIEVTDLVSHRLPVSEFEHGIELMEQGRENVMKVMLRPGDEA
jgi:2-desacetyl-2-hydroxyethyl bacteriochlorophyllide A dehydrogenase